MRAVQGILLALTAVPVVISAATSNEIYAIKARYESERNTIVGDYSGKISSAGDRYADALTALHLKLTATGETARASEVGAEIERLKTERVLLSTPERTVLMLDGVRRTENLAGQRAGGVNSTESEAPRTASVPRQHASERAEPATQEDGRAAHCAVGAHVTVSSTHLGEPGETSPTALVDGDLFTRWSSDYFEPQEVILRLEKPTMVDSLRLHWEKASATRYCVYLSSDNVSWNSIYLYMNIGAGGEPASRVDEVDARGTLAKWIKLDLQSCVNKKWGFSLYEIEVVGRSVSSAQPAKQITE